MPSSPSKRPGAGDRVAFVLLTVLLAVIVAAFGLIIAVADAVGAPYPAHGAHRHFEAVAVNVEAYVLVGILIAVLVVGVVRWVRGRSTWLVPLLGLGAMVLTFAVEALVDHLLFP